MADSNAEDDDLIHIGKTTYYKVRKGGAHYRIVTGKKMTDLDCCWQVVTNGGKTYFVSLAGEKKWHLPDIKATPDELEKERQELLRRKQEREQREREAAAAAAERRANPTRTHEKFQLGDGQDPPPPGPHGQHAAGAYKKFKDGEEHEDSNSKKGCPCCVQ